MESTSNTGAISVGTEDDPNLILPVIVADQTNLSAGDVHGILTTTQKADKLMNEGEYVAIAGGANIEMDITVNDLTSGVIEYYCEWYPLSTDGNVV